MTESAERCIWPGCTRPRAPGRVSGSGRQKEYCLQADPPERGGSPVHNARNRWAALRGGGGAPVPAPGAQPGDTAGAPAAGPPGAELSPLTSAKRRAGELLEQARRQHASALASLAAERELYAGIGAQLAVLSDPAAADLEVATIASRAGRDLAQAAEDAAQARRAQLAAERARDDAAAGREAADAAAEQAAEDAEAAERALAERTAGFERDLADQIDRARAAAEGEHAARAAAAAAVSAAEEAADQARQQMEQAAAAVSAARRETAAAQARADELIGQARADAERERAAARLARDETVTVRAEAETARQLVRDAQAAQRRAEAQVASAQAEAQAAVARAAAVDDEAARLRAGLRERDDAHAAELARLAAAHQAALEAERALRAAEQARAARAEAGLDALRRENPAG